MLDQRLLQPGWGGELAPEELEFIKAKVARSRRLSQKWGFTPEQKRIAERSIQRVAMDGEPKDPSINQKLARRPGAKCRR